MPSKRANVLELENLQYYAVTLSANSGRVIIRDWMEGNFRELVENVNAWFDDLSIVTRDGKGLVRSLKLVDLLGATARELSDVQAPIAAATPGSVRALSECPSPTK